MSDDLTTDAEGLQNISEGGKAPQGGRVADYESGASIVRNLIEEDENDFFDRVNEQALADGEGPFLQEELDNSGQEWRKNDNWGGAAAKFEQAIAPYHDLHNGVSAELDYSIKGAEREQYQAVIAESWPILHNRIWDTHSFERHNLFRLFVGFGVGIADREHPVDFRWRAGGLGEHYFPRPIQAYERAANIHVRVREFREDELWRWYKNPKAKEIGFNLDAIKRAMLACNERGGNKDDYWSQLQGRNNIYGTTYSRRAVVKLFTLRSVEITDDGEEKVSEYIGQVDGKDESEFIYQSKKPMWMPSMADAFTLFPAGIGNGTLHSIKGLLRKVFATSQTENQFINKMFDFANIYMSPMFESDTANGAQLLKAMQIGIFNLIPKGLKLVSTSAVAPNYAQSIIPLLGFCAQLGDNATGVYRQSLTPASVEQTREEVVQRTMQNAVVTSAAINLFSAADERLQNATLKRLINKNYGKAPGWKERQEWMKWNTDRGVPEEVLYKIVHIKPNRTVGGGSAAVGQMLLEKAAGMLRPYLDPVGQKQLDLMLATRLLGNDAAKSLIPEIGIVRPTEAQQFAKGENRFFRLGLVFPPDQTDDHFAHVQMHDLGWIDTEAALSQGQMQPPQMLAFLSAFVPHQGEHFKMLGNNPKQASDIGRFHANHNRAIQLQEKLQNAAQAEQNRLAQLAQAQQQASQAGNLPGSGIKPEDQAKLAAKQAEAELDLKIKAASGQQDLAQRAAAANQKLAIHNQTAAQKAAARDAESASRLLDSAGQPLALPQGNGQ